MPMRFLDDDQGDAASSIELSVVIPCLNEAATIGGCVVAALRGIKSAGVTGEVVVADNGSDDGSRAIAENHGARVVLVESRGYGAAIRGGIAQALGRYIIMGDADGEHDLTLLSPFLERLRAGDDLVVGNRFRGGIADGAMPWTHRYIGTPLLTFVLNLLFRSPVHDAQCGMRGFPRDSVARLGLTSEGMEFASEMIVSACLQHQRISEIPVPQLRSGRGRPSHLRSVRDGLRHLDLILDRYFRRRR